jgi:hypothetical protein
VTNPQTQRRGPVTSEAPPEKISRHHDAALIREDSSTGAEIPESAGLAALDALAEHVDGAFVLVVKVTGGRYRRRCFLSAASAQRAVDRALARGENAVVYLAALQPLFRLTGGAA